MLNLLRLVLELTRLMAASSSRRIAATSGLIATAVLFALVGFIGFGAALWIWLAQVLDPISAALIIGGLGFFLAAIFLLLAQRRPPPPSLMSSPLAQQVLKEFSDRKTTGEVWAPLIGVALAAFFLAAKSDD